MSHRCLAYGTFILLVHLSLVSVRPNTFCLCMCVEHLVLLTIFWGGRRQADTFGQWSCGICRKLVSVLHHGCQNPGLPQSRL
jgi:hypothetical protein